MTVETTIAKSGPYAGAGTVGPFTIGFRFLDNAHLRVTKTDSLGVNTTLVLDADYTVTGAGGISGSLTLLAVLPVGAQIVIARDVPATQLADYVQGDAFPAQSHEDALDKLTMIAQQNQEGLSRSIKFPESDAVPSDPTLPNLASRANKYLLFTANGGLTVSSGTGVDAGLRTDLLDSAGSSLIGFKQAGIGARSMTAQDKMRQRVNIRDYGAIGDGTLHPLSERFASLALAQAVYPFATSLTNSIDWAALQAAINYGAGGVAEVHIPSGTFVLHAPRQGTQICMVNISSNLTIIGNGYNSCLKVADNYSAGGDYRVMASSSGANVDYFTMTGVRFDGNGTNNLVIDSGVNVRRGYSINILAGIRPEVIDCWFENNPGRNVINFGNNANPPSIIKARIIGNRINNVGGAIVGNQNQNDHSSIYCQSTLGLVAFNHFGNDASFNPLGSPSFACVALEIHGNQTDVIGNIVNNYGTGGNLVASVHNSYDNRWLNNKFLNMVSNVLTLWTFGGFSNIRLTIRGNLITINNVTYPAGTGIYQNTSSTITSLQIQDIVIEDNTIQFLQETPTTGAAPAIQLTAVNGGTVRRNKIYNCQVGGIHCINSVTPLNIYNLDIDDNEFDNCGIQTSLSRIWAIYISNTNAAVTYSKIRIRRNKILRRLPVNVGDTPFSSRGINIVGPGQLQDIRIAGDNIYSNLDRNNRVVFTTPTNNRSVIVDPSFVSNTKTALPIRGQFNIGQEIIQYNDYVAGGSVGRVITTSGSGVEGTWAASTAYIAGQWIQTSTGKVIECIVGGTSDPTTEPAPTTLGSTFTDGSVTWVYRDSAVAKFAEYGASYLTGTASYTPAAIANGAKFTVSVTVTAAVLGDVATASYSAALQGLTMSCSIDSSNVANVTFANNTGSSVTLAAGTIYVRASKQ